VIRRTMLATLLAAGLASAAFSFQKAKPEDEKVRMVEGLVTDGADNPINGAVVQLKNTKTLQVRSFITQDEGTYQFHGLDTSIDYALKADYKGVSSATRTLSSFDSRRRPVINLKIETKK